MYNLPNCYSSIAVTSPLFASPCLETTPLPTPPVMPTPSSNPPNPPSPRFYPFSSCPDAEEHEQPSQSGSEAATSPEPPSPSSWRPFPPPIHPADHGERANPNTSGDSRSVTMSPGPLPEDASRDVDMGHEPEGMVGSRDAAGERHKPADADEDMSHTAGETARGGAVGGNGRAGSGGRERTRTTALGEPPGRRKSRTEHLSAAVGETKEVGVWSPGGRRPRWVEDSGLAGLGLEYSHMRVMTPAPSLYLEPGSVFVGSQQSERQRYAVEVEIKHVDMRQSFLCGYLKIQGALCFAPLQRLDSLRLTLAHQAWPMTTRH